MAGWWSCTDGMNSLRKKEGVARRSQTFSERNEIRREVRSRGELKVVVEEIEVSMRGE